jgi:hypothetical protein
MAGRHFSLQTRRVILEKTIIPKPFRNKALIRRCVPGFLFGRRALGNSTELVRKHAA